MGSTNPVIIVGGGLSGISAAKRLEKEGLRPILLEASDRLGGRVRTDEVDGFLLDVGFQVVLNSYPEIPSRCQRDLGFASYASGAHYRTEDGWCTVSHPLYDPLRVTQWGTGTLGGLSVFQICSRIM